MGMVRRAAFGPSCRDGRSQRQDSFWVGLNRMGCSFADRFLALWVFEQLSFDLAGLWSTTALLVASHECFFKKKLRGVLICSTKAF